MNKLILTIIFIPILVAKSFAGEAELAAELQLVSIRDDLNIFMLAGEESNEVKEKLAESMLKKVMLVRSVTPEVSEIKGEALESICLISENLEVFDYVKNKPVVDLAKTYINEIEDKAKKQIAKYQKTMKGQGCYLSPKNENEGNI